MLQRLGHGELARELGNQPPQRRAPLAPLGKDSDGGVQDLIGLDQRGGGALDGRFLVDVDVELGVGKDVQHGRRAVSGLAEPEVRGLPPLRRLLSHHGVVRRRETSGHAGVLRSGGSGVELSLGQGQGFGRLESDVGRSHLGGCLQQRTVEVAVLAHSAGELDPGRRRPRVRLSGTARAGIRPLGGSHDRRGRLDALQVKRLQGRLGSCLLGPLQLELGERHVQSGHQLVDHREGHLAQPRRQVREPSLISSQPGLHLRDKGLRCLCLDPRPVFVLGADPLVQQLALVGMSQRTADRARAVVGQGEGQPGDHRVDVRGPQVRSLDGQRHGGLAGRQVLLREGEQPLLDLTELHQVGPHRHQAVTVSADQRRLGRRCPGGRHLLLRELTAGRVTRQHQLGS